MTKKVPKSAKPAVTQPQPIFCASLRPEHPRNVEAARACGLRYDSEKRSYVDQLGRLVRDIRGVIIR